MASKWFYEQKEEGNIAVGADAIEGIEIQGHSLREQPATQILETEK